MIKNKNERGPRKETIMDFTEYLNKEVHVYFNGGRTIKGILKSFDQTNNLILDNVIEQFKIGNGTVPKQQSRQLDLVFVRGTEISSIFPCPMNEISNPFTEK